jgi:hypothetical protein
MDLMKVIRKKEIISALKTIGALVAVAGAITLGFVCVQELARCDLDNRDGESYDYHMSYGTSVGKATRASEITIGAVAGASIGALIKTVGALGKKISGDKKLYRSVKATLEELKKDNE